MNNIYVIHALLAAALFGASTPFAKLLVGEMSPWLLAGLLYLGSGLGLAAARLIRDRGWTPSGLAKGRVNGHGCWARSCSAACSGRLR